jgi:hypothetical protein
MSDKGIFSQTKSKMYKTLTCAFQHLNALRDMFNFATSVIILWVIKQWSDWSALTPNRRPILSNRGVTIITYFNSRQTWGFHKTVFFFSNLTWNESDGNVSHPQLEVGDCHTLTEELLWVLLQISQILPRNWKHCEDFYVWSKLQCLHNLDKSIKQNIDWCICDFSSTFPWRHTLMTEKRTTLRESRYNSGSSDQVYTAWMTYIRVDAHRYHWCLPQWPAEG